MEKGKRYIVTYPFRDLQDKSIKYPNGKPYAIGDIYIDLAKQDKRIRELESNNNNIGKPLIKLEGEEQPIKADKQVDNVIAYNDITKAEIGQLLEDKGIEYNARDTKRELYNLLLGSD